MRNELTRWVKPPVLLNPELLRQKNAVRPIDRIWIYWPVIVLVALIPCFVLNSIWLAGPFTLQALATLWMVFNSVTFVIVGVIAIVLATSACKDDPLRLNNPTELGLNLSYTGRRKLCLYERNRKRALHYRERRGRYAETDREYSQYSVWPDPTDNGVRLTVIEHLPPGSFRFRRPVRYASDGYGRLLSLSYTDNPSFEDMLEHQQKAEEIAEQLEAQQYEKAIGGREAQRNAMMLRR